MNSNGAEQRRDARKALAAARIPGARGDHARAGQSGVRRMESHIDPPGTRAAVAPSGHATNVLRTQTLAIRYEEIGDPRCSSALRLFGLSTCQYRNRLERDVQDPSTDECR